MHEVKCMRWLSQAPSIGMITVARYAVRVRIRGVSCSGDFRSKFSETDRNVSCCVDSHVRRDPRFHPNLCTACVHVTSKISLWAYSLRAHPITKMASVPRQIVFVIGTGTPRYEFNTNGDFEPISKHDVIIHSDLLEPRKHTDACHTRPFCHDSGHKKFILVHEPIGQWVESVWFFLV